MGFDYIVQTQDCLSSIADKFGFSDYQIIYQDPANQEFRQKRPNPNIIYPGDKLFIPDPQKKEHAAGTAQLHKYEVQLPTVLLRLCMKDDLLQPYKGAKYRLRVGFDNFGGVTDGNGMVEQEIAPNSVDGEITIFPAGCDPAADGYSFALLLGDLDPVHETSGIDARLSNLGFVTFEESGNRELTASARADAIRAFQDKFGLEVTGELDNDTRDTLQRMHDDE
jgi:N-acetylmuramoyl-L-alanine amidase